MTDHERAIVNMFNDHFQSNPESGIAHRKKQHRFTSQLCDLIVDSDTNHFYIAIEAKSIKEKNNNKLYFSQHFSKNNEGHQVERITNFIKQSGRTGYLCLELKRGRGRPRQCYLLPWKYIDHAYNIDEVGMTLAEIKDLGFKIKREGSNYILTEELEEYLKETTDEHRYI